MTDALFPKGATLIFGATGGVGKTVAYEFAKAESDIALMWYSKEDAAKQLAKDIEKIGRKVSLHQCDVTDFETLSTAIKVAITHHGRIHTMVWGAGPLAEQVLIAESTRAQWHKAINVEVNGFYDATTSLIPHMRAQGGGSFVHLGSAGDTAFPPKDVLSVSPKAANESLIKGIAREEGVHNIRANSVLLGVIEAGMFLELTKQGVFEIAQAAIFLASNKAGYITGQQISVSGGYGL